MKVGSELLTLALVCEQNSSWVGVHEALGLLSQISSTIVEAGPGEATRTGTGLHRSWQLLYSAVVELSIYTWFIVSKTGGPF